mmetsp:Transcript_29552/g.54685  ORF Transcript_29552/g.54685 Transcript_29552/m.54685 type:complete len:156 (-) Transcript_29552:4-471(-)
MIYAGVLVEGRLEPEEGGDVRVEAWAQAKASVVAGAVRLVKGCEPLQQAGVVGNKEQFRLRRVECAAAAEAQAAEEGREQAVVPRVVQPAVRIELMPEAGILSERVKGGALRKAPEAILLVRNVQRVIDVKFLVAVIVQRCELPLDQRNHTHHQH